MPKITTSSGDREKFDSNNIEKELKADGMPESVAEEVAERVEDKVQDGWTTKQIREQVGLEIKRVQEDTDRAYSTFMGEARNRMESQSSRIEHRETY